MCEPTTMLVLSVAQSALGYIQQSQSAKAQTRALTEENDRQMEATQLQYDQNNKQALDKMSARGREAAIEAARLRVIAGESGIAGGSNDRVLNESAFNYGSDIASIESNRKATNAQLYEEAKSGRARTVSKINAIDRPSLIGTGLQIAGAGVQYDSAKKKQAADKKAT